jgi:AcrR family transcriptional regulator
MSRTKGSSGPRTKQAIREAGLGLIYRHGYEGMSLRDLAEAVGIQQGSLYNHISAKQDLLFLIMREHMETIIAGLDAALAGLGDPIAQLEAFTTFHLTYHMERRQEVTINNSELRSLEPANRRKIMVLREAYEQRLIRILADGAAASRCAIADIKVTAFALLAMLTGICAWYQPKGPLTKADLVAQHTALVLRGVLNRA